MSTKRITLDAVWPEMPEFKEGIRRAPDRGYTLNDQKTVTALKTRSVIFRKNFMRKQLPNS